MSEKPFPMSAITEAVMRGRDGDPAGARSDLAKIWKLIEDTDDSFHRCVLAHYMADLHEPEEAIIWDERALSAAIENPDLTEGFLPSLHLNIADNRRRLGDFSTAARHLDLARAALPSLAAGPYAEQIEQWIGDVHSLNDAHLTSPLSTAPEGGSANG